MVLIIMESPSLSVWSSLFRSNWLMNLLNLWTHMVPLCCGPRADKCCPFKAWSRSVYSQACLSTTRNFFLGLNTTFPVQLLTDHVFLWQAPLQWGTADAEIRCRLLSLSNARPTCDPTGLVGPVQLWHALVPDLLGMVKNLISVLAVPI